jgi:hypothetical protein
MNNRIRNQAGPAAKRGSMRLLPVLLATIALMLACGVTPALADDLAVLDVVPTVSSAETGQNSEVSLAVNPTNANQIVVGAFGASSNPFFSSTNGGTSFSNYGGINDFDKTLSWSPTGNQVYVSAITSVFFTGLNATGGVITTQASNSGSFPGTFFPNTLDTLNNPVNTGVPDQPWLAVSNAGGGAKDHVFVAFNDLSNGANSASIRLSSDGGSTWSTLRLETTTPGAGQDAPSIRTAVNGNTVYAVFNRWNNTLTNTSDGATFSSQIVIKRDDSGGTAGFNALGAGGAIAASPTTVFSTNDNGPLSVGFQRSGSDLSIAVDPNNANHVVVAYQELTGGGLLRVKVGESTDGGATWSSKLSVGVTSGLPALSIDNNGRIAFEYVSLESGYLVTHFLTTSNDFATTSDAILNKTQNSATYLGFDPFLGDFTNVQAVGNTFYGVFGALNLDNGTASLFPSGVSFQRDFTGTPGTGSFGLVDGSNNAVGGSIDPFFFSSTVPEPGTLLLLGTGLLGVFGGRRKLLAQ